MCVYVCVCVWKKGEKEKKKKSEIFSGKLELTKRHLQGFVVVFFSLSFFFFYFFILFLFVLHAGPSLHPPLCSTQWEFSANRTGTAKANKTMVHRLLVNRLRLQERREPLQDEKRTVLKVVSTAEQLATCL